MKKKFLVLGSNSFSGSSLVNFLLKRNYQVIGISRSNLPHKIFLPYNNNKNLQNYKFFKINIKETEKIVSIISKYKPNYILNFAAQGMVNESWKKPIDWYSTNIIYQTSLVEKLRKFSFIEKYINFTTPEVYGNNDKWIKENYNFNPSTPYAVSRASFDYHLKCLQEAYDFPILFTRTANVYGPHQQLYRIIPRAFMAAKNVKKLSIHGDGNSKRSFIHISDVCSALHKIILNGKIGHTYHISGQKLYTINNIVTLIGNIYKLDINDFSERLGERLRKDMAYKLNSSKLRNELKWEDKVDIRKGLKDCFLWIETNFDLLKKMSLIYKHKK